MFVCLLVLNDLVFFGGCLLVCVGFCLLFNLWFATLAVGVLRFGCGVWLVDSVATGYDFFCLSVSFVLCCGVSFGLLLLPCFLVVFVFLCLF